MRRLTLAEKLGLIYTSAGSQRNVAALVGISHQKVGRILHGQVTDKVLLDPGLIQAIDLAFSIHKDITRSQAKRDGLPYDPALPVYMRRLPFKDGTPGDRVAALHTHWLSNDVRSAWILALQASRKFASVSIGSVVDLVIYSDAADRLNGKRYLDEKTEAHRKSILKKIEDAQRNAMVYTPMSYFDFPGNMLLRDIENKLQEKHAPALGDNGKLATKILLQVDTRKNQNGESKDKAFRDKHPYGKKPATKRPKARQAEARSKRR